MPYHVVAVAWSDISATAWSARVWLSICSRGIRMMTPYHGNVAIVPHLAEQVHMAGVTHFGVSTSLLPRAKLSEPLPGVINLPAFQVDLVQGIPRL